MHINFEDRLENSLNEEILIPKSVLDKKELAFEQIKKKNQASDKFSYKHKVAVAVVASICILGTVSFGNTAFANIKSLFSNDSGIQKAVDNGYVQQVVTNNTMKDKGVEIKLTDVTCDKNKLALSLNLKFDDKSLVSHFYSLGFDIEIKDDKGRYIARDEGDCLTGSADWNTDVNKDTGEIKLNLVLSSNGQLVDINKINLKLSQIQLFASLNDNIENSVFTEAESKLDKDTLIQLKDGGVRLYKELNGTWENNIKLDDKFKDSKSIKYSAEGNNNFVNVISAEMSPTGMQITFITDASSDLNSRINKITLVDEKGKTYKQTTFGSQEYVDGDDIKFKVSLNFEATTFDNLGNLKMIAKDSNGKNVEIKLKK